MPFALYALALAVFAMGTSEFMLAGLVPAMSTDLDVPVGAVGLLTSAFAVGMVVGAPTMAAFARAWPPRPTLLACLAVFSICHVVGATTSTFELLLIARVISALANAGFLAVALRTATLLVPRERTGRALAVLLSGTTIATIVGVPAGALLGTALNWRATFAAVALLSLGAIVGVVRGVPASIPVATATGTGMPTTDTGTGTHTADAMATATDTPDPTATVTGTADTTDTADTTSTTTPDRTGIHTTDPTATVTPNATGAGTADATPDATNTGPSAVSPSPDASRSRHDASGGAPSLRAELALLATPRLAVAMILAALVNGGTFAVFTFLAPIVTETAGLPDAAVSVSLVLFGVGSFAGVTIAGRLADRHAGVSLAVGAPLLLVGWLATAAVAAQPIVLMTLVFVQGVLSFGVGSTLITRVLYAATGAPTMGGSYATAALNIGAVIGPACGAWTLASGAGPHSPVAVAAALTAAAAALLGLTAPLTRRVSRAPDPPRLPSPLPPPAARAHGAERTLRD